MGTVTCKEFAAFKASLVFHQQTAFFLREFGRELSGAGSRGRWCFRIRSVCIARRGEWLLVRFHSLFNSLRYSFVLDDATVVKILDF